MSDEALYQSLVLTRSRAPLYAGRPTVFEAQGHGENRMCGDEVSVFFTRNGAGWRHEAKGCAILVASADLMCTALNGQPDSVVAPLSVKFERLVKTGDQNPDLGDLNALASIAHYPARLRCATLPWNAANNALAGGASGTPHHG